jgi:hypothetical protein
MPLEILAAAGAKQRAIVGEVPVNCHLANFCTVGNIADRRCGNPFRLMQFDRRIDDFLPCLFLALGTLSQSVSAFHDIGDTHHFVKLDKHYFRL